MDAGKIKEILLKQNYISASDLKNAEEVEKKKRIDPIDYLISKNIISKDTLGQAIAEHFKVKYTDLNSIQPSKENILKIPEKTAEKYNIVLVNENEKKVTVTSDNPIKKGLSERLVSIFGDKQIVLTFSLTEDIRANFIHYKKSLDTRCEKIIKNQNNIASGVVEEIIKEALSFNASDVHFEPMSEDFLIRFRIDGVLQEAGRLPLQFFGNVLNRIKVQSGLRIDEHQTTQDGAIRYVEDNGQAVDIRVSITPTINGEKAVLRMLSSHVKTLSLSSLGLSEEDEEKISEVASKPFGMILVTGPTGSGKTTTLYAILKLLNQPEVNITTIEDPVEYRVENISQIQVNAEKGITFAKGLKSIVRQDPDIILVGEIRDKETAEISINAALTGHLLLSTFHANNAASAIPRLLDMGVERFLLSSTLDLIVAQRLVRKLCESCRYSVPVKKEDIYGLPDEIKSLLVSSKNIYKSKGCSVCNSTGYKGRVAIFETMNVTPEIKDVIMRDSSAKAVWETAKKQGAVSLFEDGIKKVRSGITSLEELKRVSSPSEY